MTVFLHIPSIPFDLLRDAHFSRSNFPETPNSVETTASPAKKNRPRLREITCSSVAPHTDVPSTNQLPERKFDPHSLARAPRARVPRREEAILRREVTPLRELPDMTSAKFWGF